MINELTDFEEAHLITSLKDVLDEWWQVECEKLESIPCIGDRTYFLMARAAVSILQANADAEKYIEEQR